ncbi:hypothetical protein GYH30_007970 [Glycine max]|nr:hypothetical protein GYH30_007970 [Glycine max]
MHGLMFLLLLLVVFFYFVHVVELSGRRFMFLGLMSFFRHYVLCHFVTSSILFFKFLKCIILSDPSRPSIIPPQCMCL